jgi:hypothetical protein
MYGRRYPEETSDMLMSVMRGALGRAVQVDPIKPTLRVPGTKHLKLKHYRSIQFCVQIQLAPLQLGDHIGNSEDVKKVRSARYCSPRQPTHFKPRVFVTSGILCSFEAHDVASNVWRALACDCAGHGHGVEGQQYAALP